MDLLFLNVFLAAVAVVVLLWQFRRFSFVKLTHPKCSVPMYYINLDKSTARRRHMESTFGDWGTLTRFPAIHNSDNATIADLVDMRNAESPAAYFAQAKATGLGSGTLLLNNALLIKKAFDDGLRHVLILEDDMSDVLAPFWRWSIDELIEKADTDHPGWYVLQLQCLFISDLTVLSQAWKFNPVSPFFPKKLLFSNGINTWGAGANLYSRKGLEYYSNVMFNSDGKFDCLSPVDLHYNTSGVRCHPDNFLYKLPNIQSQTLLVLPPMFTTMVNEGSTGLRKGKAGHESDHTSHLKMVLAALNSNILAKASFTYQEDFDTEFTAFEEGTGYAVIEEELKELLGYDGDSTIADRHTSEFILRHF